MKILTPMSNYRFVTFRGVYIYIYIFIPMCCSDPSPTYMEKEAIAMGCYKRNRCVSCFSRLRSHANNINIKLIL